MKGMTLRIGAALLAYVGGGVPCLLPVAMIALAALCSVVPINALCMDIFTLFFWATPYVNILGICASGLSLVIGRAGRWPCLILFAINTAFALERLKEVVLRSPGLGVLIAKLAGINPRHFSLPLDMP